MSSSHLRGSPWMLASGALLAGLLVLIAVLVAGTEASGTHPSSTVSARAPASPAIDPVQAGALAAAQSRIAALQVVLQAQAHQLAGATTTLRGRTAQLAGTAASLRAARADARCWRRKFKHPFKTHALRCAPP